MSPQSRYNNITHISFLLHLLSLLNADWFHHLQILKSLFFLMCCRKISKRINQRPETWSSGKNIFPTMLVQNTNTYQDTFFIFSFFPFKSSQLDCFYVQSCTERTCQRRTVCKRWVKLLTHHNDVWYVINRSGDLFFMMLFSLLCLLE